MKVFRKDLRPDLWEAMRRGELKDFEPYERVPLLMPQMIEQLKGHLPQFAGEQRDELERTIKFLLLARQRGCELMVFYREYPYAAVA